MVREIDSSAGKWQGANQRLSPAPCTPTPVRSSTHGPLSRLNSPPRSTLFPLTCSTPLSIRGDDHAFFTHSLVDCQMRLGIGRATVYRAIHRPSLFQRAVRPYGHARTIFSRIGARRWEVHPLVV